MMMLAFARSGATRQSRCQGRAEFRTKFREAAIDIASWLQEIGLAEHIEIFRAEKIGAAVLPTLSDADLRELGLPARRSQEIACRHRCAPYDAFHWHSVGA